MKLTEILLCILLNLWENPDASEFCRILRPSIEESSTILTQPLALEYILKYTHLIGFPQEMKLDHSQKIAHIQNILTKEFLPHIDRIKPKKRIILVTWFVNYFLHLWVVLIRMIGITIKTNV